MGRMLTIIGLAAALAAQPARAAQESHIESGGARWQSQENRHGAIVWRGGVRFYLGRSCDAWSPRFGRGRWGWANGGWLVIFPGRRLGFPRQDPPINAPCDTPS